MGTKLLSLIQRKLGKVLVLIQSAPRLLAIELLKGIKDKVKIEWKMGKIG